MNVSPNEPLSAPTNPPLNSRPNELQGSSWFQQLPLSTVIAAAAALALIAGLAGGWISSLVTRPAATAAALTGTCNATDVAQASCRELSQSPSGTGMPVAWAAV